MNYDLKSLAVVNLFIVPKHFFVREIIEERKPSSRRYVSSFNICAIADLSISCLVVVIACDLEETRMAWFLNFYKCARCRRRWTDEWSCMCDDECPHCGARDMTPYQSEELTTIIEEEGKEFIVFWSPETAEHDPDYRELGRFPSREKALEFLSADG